MSFVIFACSAFSLPAQSRYEASRVSMACTYTIVVYGENEPVLKQAADEAFDEIDRIDRLMSNYKPDSPLSIINREAATHPIKIDPELFDFIAECLKYSQRSDGAFDITVGPLMKAWGFFRGEGRMPTDVELADAHSKVGYRHVILNGKEKSISFDKHGVELDLGGIAKGYAVDRAVRMLERRGIKSALVSAGGSTIYGLGSQPGKNGWQLNLQDPVDQRKTAMTVILKNRALSVSGDYEKFFEVGGVRYSHIMDPRTGRPVQGVLSVAVITSSGTEGDALDNIFYVRGVDWSRDYLKGLRDTDFYFFLPGENGGWKLVRYRER